MEVSRHYNKHRPRVEASEEMIGIRNFHNFVKAHLISEACAGPGPHARFLDMCCGNGGDVSKLRHNGVTEYFGMDIADAAVERAERRLAEQTHVSGDVIVFNAFSATAGHMLERMKRFDVASCQFAIHYAFSDERTARTFIQNVASALRVGGSFVVTVPDYDFLSRSRKLLGKQFGDQYYSVKFESASAEIQDFGAAYEFSFKGAVERLKEYVVKPDVLTRLCGDCGMRLVASRNFSEYRHHSGTPLWTRMGARYNDVSRVYRTYHFEMEEHRADDEGDD